MSLCDANIFHARQILRNFRTKKSAFIDNQRNFVQILCLVGDTDEILVHYNYYGELNSNAKDAFADAKASSCRGVGGSKTSGDSNTFGSNWKLIVWFQKTHKQIQGLCFDPNGSQLLVVCYDNTLHIVPILWIINPECGLKTTTSQEIENFYWPFRSDEITSFIVPFSGPHECSNSKTCPNNANAANECARNGDRSDDDDKYTPEQINEMVLSNGLYRTFYLNDERNDESPPIVDDNTDALSVKEKSPDGCEKTLPQCTDEQKSGGNCPYPLSVVWWVTSKCDEQNGQHRALIGYSDGSICVVGLTPNCPFIANTSIDSKSGGIEKMTICRDPIVKSVSLLINSSYKEQWKLLLEQNSIGYTFPDDIQNCLVDNSQSQLSNGHATTPMLKAKNSEDDWQIIIPVPCANASSDNDGRLAVVDDDDADSKDEFVHLNAEVGASSTMMTIATTHAPGGIFPAARARLASLRDLGAKKIGALKLKLIENKIKSNERDRNRQHMTPLACMHIPSFSPEILTTPAGPYFIVQFLKGSHLLSALHPYSDTLSVHSMDISLIPLHIYKIPKDCSDILITPYIMFTKQTIAQTKRKHNDPNADPKTESEFVAENCERIDAEDESHNVNAIGVIGCNSTALRIGEDSEFNQASMLSLFLLPDENIIDIHRAPFRPCDTHIGRDDGIDYGYERNNHTVDQTSNATSEHRKITAKNYVNYQSEQHQRRGKNGNTEHLFDFDDRRVIEHEFPIIDLDKCIVVTDRSMYFIEFRDHPHIVFLNLVREGKWKACEEFCKIFELDFNQCIEYAGDVLLKKKKTTQALLTFNVAKIVPVKTALKLAMFGQNGALMHLCAMALKIVYLLRSSTAKNHTIKYLLDSMPSLSSSIEPKRTKKSKNDLNCGILCSDFSYDRDDTPGDLQMSNPSQFHLSNLLLLTLTEKAIKDKQYMPLWNFLVTNKRYHTNMSSIVLAQSGLYASTIILALNRGAHLDAFCALVAVTNQEFGWYSEINDILHNLSDPIFIECIIYLQHVSNDYFDCIQMKIDKINETVLERLRQQLDPFAAIFRPVVSQLSSNFIESDTNDINKKLIEFCRHLIETFLIICIRLYTIKCTRDDVCNGLNMIYVRHEENQFAIKVDNSASLSAGFSHCAAIVDGSCYIWGSNGINCALNNSNSAAGGGSDFGTEATPKCLEFISSMGLEVHAVKCGKAHTLILTNNGLYAMGSNMMGQLGIGKHQIQALQPMLVPEFDGKNVTLIEVGQYHNAIYADGNLYTWGWGIYGQLGHGNVFMQDRPKIVHYFKNKEVKQIALGHAHSLVLCGSKLNANETVLYVFGCNLFGQLGTGQQNPNMPHQKFLKSLVPMRIDLAQETITQIHTKFFTNFVVTKSNKLFTWGASPQLIRLMNQARKRARMAQKFEETKTTIANDTGASSNGQNSSDFNENFTEAAPIDSNDRDREENFKNCTLAVDELPLSNGDSTNDNNRNGVQREEGDELIDIAVGKINNEPPPMIIDKLANSPLAANLEERIKKFLNSKTPSTKAATSSEESATLHQDPSQLETGKSGSAKLAHDFEEECTEHLYPNKVDTSNVIGEIIQVSSGLYHSALVTNKSQLYTWGKNLEKQLGRESSRCDLAAPTLLELNDNVIFVECGADFTIIMTDYYMVKAFGNNNYGQCGRELSVANDRNSIAGKLVRLRVSKRVVRLPDTSQCVDQPMEVPLPRPKIRMNFDAVRYLKSVPKFRSEFISRDIFDAASRLRVVSDDDDGNSTSSDAADDTKLTNKFASLNLLSGNNSEWSESASDQLEISSDFIHYCLFIFHGIYDPHKIIELAALNEFKVRILMLNYYVKGAFTLCLAAAKTTVQTTSIPSKKIVATCDKDGDAVVDCERLSDYVIKLFEYFTKDASIVPIHRTDLKYLIHAIFMYFIRNSMPLEPIESYFLSNIDHYLFGLAIVLYFNNNNSKLEQQVQHKYTHLFSGCAVNDSNAYNHLYAMPGATAATTTTINSDDSGDENSSSDNANDPATPGQCSKQRKTNNDEMMLDFEVIFNSVSTTFKTIICQRLIEFDNDLN